MCLLSIYYDKLPSKNVCTFPNSDPYLRQKILQCRHCLRHVVWAMTFNHRSYHGPHWGPLVARLKLFDTTETILTGALLQRHGLSLNILLELVCKIENLWMLLTMIMIPVITIILNLPHKTPKRYWKSKTCLKGLDVLFRQISAGKWNALIL